MKYLYILSLIFVSFNHCADLGKTEECQIKTFNDLTKNIRDSHEEIQGLLAQSQKAQTNINKKQLEQDLFDTNKFTFHRTKTAIKNAFKNHLITLDQKHSLKSQLEKISWDLLDRYK
jgi:hypothetical protein